MQLDNIHLPDTSPSGLPRRDDDYAASDSHLSMRAFSSVVITPPGQARRGR